LAAAGPISSKSDAVFRSARRRPVIQQALQPPLGTASQSRDTRRHPEVRSPPLSRLCSWVHQSILSTVRPIFPRCASSGADGVILPVELEESVRFKTEIDRNGLSQILSWHRRPFRAITAIDAASGGFLYCVSTTESPQAGRGRRGFLFRVKPAEENPLSWVRHLNSAEADTPRFLSDGVIIGRTHQAPSRRAVAFHSGWSDPSARLSAT